MFLKAIILYGSSFWIIAATQNCRHPQDILLTSLLGRTCKMCLVFLIKLIRGQNLALAGLLQSLTIFFMSM